MRFYSKLIIVFTFFLQTTVFSQSAVITIDGNFEDWSPSLTTFSDVSETIYGIDLIDIQVTNDANFLFIKIKTSHEFDLTDTTIPQNIVLLIDADNNENTGFNAQQGYGTEIGIVFNELFAHYNVEPYSQVSFSDFGMRVAPTVTSNEFEIAIKRNISPDGINPLFTTPTIKILLKNDQNFDEIPNVGEVFSYTFDETPVAPYIPIEITKEDQNLIRIVAYNTLFNGLLDSNRLPNFENIITVLNPDIIGFVESADTSTTYIKSLFDSWIPLETEDGWFVEKHGGEVIASRWEIIQTWDLTRQFPVLIDLPDNYNSDLVFTTAHLSCCGADVSRQEQVDEYAQFILDAKIPGGDFTFPENIPFVYAGDLNLVGSAQQLTTLITGAIQNTATYGEGGALDWDDSDLTDQYSLQTDNRMAYTWRDDSSAFPPGKLDFFIFSDAVINAEKAFVLQTEVMSNERLNFYGLSEMDTSSASDHFPIVTDFYVNHTANINDIENMVEIYPNPTSSNVTIKFNDVKFYDIKLFDTFGRIINTNFNISESINFDLTKLTSGVYFLEVKTKEGQIFFKKLIKN